jgi:subtilisin-like proprotein convertase family protein
VSGINYQLYKDGAAIGTPKGGSTGNAITFGNQSATGVYTVKTNSSCATNMNGSTTIFVTPQPNTTFTYTTYNYCKSGNSSEAVLAGSPANGTFSASPAGLVFADATTGVIDLGASSVGAYSISYTVAAVGGCGVYTYTQPTQINIITTADVYSVTGGGGYCAGSGGVPVGLEKSQLGVSYELYRNGILAGTYSGTGTALNFGNQTIAGTYFVKAILGACSEYMDDEAVVTINPLPAGIQVTPATATVCQGTIMPITASLSSSSVTTASVSASSGNINLSIPKNDASGTFSLLKVTGIPVGATITSVSVNFKITQPRTGNLVINLKGPNGNVLNIANQIGGNNANFGSGTTNTFVDNNSTTNITTAAAPFVSGPYAPQASGGVGGATLVPGNVSNTTTFAGLYGATAASANGNWILSVRNNVNNANGTLNNCNIVITYTTVNNPTAVTWSPAKDLFTDPGAILPYVAGNSASTLYAKPSTSGSVTYTATATNTYGCSTSANTTLTVNASPVITISANYCSFPGKVRIIAKSSIPIANWLWSDGTAGGTPNTSKDTSFIDVNTAGDYYVSAKAAGLGCPGTAVMSIAQELVINGDFELGNVGFASDYYYQPEVAGSLENDKSPVNNGYGVGTDAHNYHSNFWGIDHTYGTGAGNFLIVNGHGSLVVWKNENVTVLPNTTYYFSAYGMSLNKAGNYAKLKFNIDGVGTYIDNFTANLSAGVENNSNNGWAKFYGKWTSGPTTTSVNLSIVNLETSLIGNDFGLDDISFATLSTFFNLTSDAASNNQTGICEGNPITDITYEVGGDGNAPSIVSGVLPPGISTYWNGRNFRLSGTPTTAGDYNFTLKSSGCNAKTQNIIIKVIPASKTGTFTGAPVISACYATSGTITLTGTVGTLQWQTSTDNVNWIPAANGDYSNLQSAIYYRVIAQNTAGCQQATSAAVKVGVKNLWIGKTNIDWNTGTNWSDESTPSTACDNVIIPQVASNRYPVLNSGSTSVKNININTNASLTVSGTGALVVSGDITNNGTLDVTKGTIEFNGTTAQTISGSKIKGKTIQNLVVNNSVSGLSVSPVANDTLNITGALSFGSATAKLNTNDNVTLKSTLNGTASIGVVNPGNVINGKFIVERFINTGTNQNADAHRKSWQLLAVPTTGATIKNSWQEGGVSNGKTPIHMPTGKGFGTLLTTGYNNVPANGFDLYTGPGPSIKTFISSKGVYDNGPVSTSNLIDNPNGYMILVRGDRSVYTSTGDAVPTVLRTKGNIITGKVGPFTVEPDKFLSIGNPYASAIDLRKLQTNEVSIFYVWDPKLSGFYGLGGFVTLSKTGDDYFATPQSGSYGAGAVNFIQSGQAFFIQGANKVGSVTINENAKETSSKTTFFRAQSRSGKIAQLRTNLYGLNFDGSALIADGTLIQYGTDYANAIDGMDARKMANTSENLSIISGGNSLVIERRQPVNAADTIFFNLSGVRVQAYRYEFIAENIAEEGLEGWLEDAYLNTRTPLNLEGTTIINFSVTNVAASYAANRFRVVFKAAAMSSPLPVTFVSVKATQKNADILVEWKVENESNLKQYEVEKSLDGNSFSKAATIAASNNRAGIYNWLDQKAVTGYNYYRIRSVDLDGKTMLTQIVKVLTGNAAMEISIYPNPITNGVVNLQLTNQPAGMYGIRMLNPIGQTIISKKITHAEGSSTEKLNWDYNLAHGMYQLEITKPNGEVKVIKVMY